MFSNKNREFQQATIQNMSKEVLQAEGTLFREKLRSAQGNEKDRKQDKGKIQYFILFVTALKKTA